MLTLDGQAFTITAAWPIWDDIYATTGNIEVKGTGAADEEEIDLFNESFCELVATNVGDDRSLAIALLGPDSDEASLWLICVTWN